MRKVLFYFLFPFAGTTFCIAQENSNVSKYADATLAVGDMEGTLSLSYYRSWMLGAKRKFEIGLGGRFTTYIARNQYYVTAPARLTSGSTGPGVLFKENIEENMDTFLIKSPQVNALNIAVNLGYHFSQKFMAGFNIDLIGFSFGGSTRGNYINGIYGQMGDGSPTSFNVLLISDNDRGTLNSEFYGKYFFNDTWGLKGGVQFLFTEYTTDEKLQQFPEPNDRFRNKSLMICLGATYKF